MTASNQPWKSYGQLLSRLLPNLSHSLLAGGDGQVLWSSDGCSVCAASTLSQLHGSSNGCRRSEIDGFADAAEAGGTQFGFRIRGALGELLGLVLVTLPAQPGERLTLAAVHAQIKPALDCLQSEFESRSAVGGLQGTDALGQIATLALEQLQGMIATLLIPACNLSISRHQTEPPPGIDGTLLAQTHHLLLTRAQLHGCTLAADGIALDDTQTALPFKAMSTPLHDPARRVIGALVVLRRDTAGDFQLRDAEALELLARRAGQIVQLSYDGSTGMLTPCAFQALAAARLAAADTRGAAHALVYVDIDQLDVTNENHGMHVGDEVIQSVATLLCRRSRAGTLLARVAGDRFVMLLPGCGMEPAARIAEELRAAAVNFSGMRGDQPLSVSLSMGVTCIGDREPRLELAMAAAEAACRTAKARGRNRVEMLRAGEKGVARLHGSGDLADQVTAALAAGSLELLAQPLLPLLPLAADPRFEILVRMRAADGVCLSPGKLLGAAADPAVARRIDSWVIEQTLNRVARCRDILRLHPVKFSLALSAASLPDMEFWRMLELKVRDQRMAPGTLTFEIPEAGASAHGNRIASRMAALQSLGAGFALDNFGRGISSLSNLNQLPVSCIKIDGSLSRDLVYNPRSQSMVLAITKLAAAFGIETVAADVETDAIRARAADLGVDFGQGFFIGRPLPLDEVLRDLPLYSCFANATGRFDTVRTVAALSA